MNDLISRQAAIEAVSSGCQELRGVFGRCEENILALPSAQPEQKRGKWIESTELSEQVKGKKFCSNCGKAQYSIEITDKTIQIKSSTSKFCPECGASMEE